MRTLTLVLTSAVLVLGARPSAAQGIDLGGSVSAMGIATVEGSGRSPVLAGPAITFKFSKRHALQVTADLFHESYGAGTHGSRLTAIYAVQYRHTFVTHNPNLVSFLTIGTAGGASREHTDAYTYTYTYTQNGTPTTFTAPAHSHFAGIPPIVPVIGWGVERTMNRRIALRGDLTGAILPFYAVAVRGSIGLVVRLGHAEQAVR